MISLRHLLFCIAWSKPDGCLSPSTNYKHYNDGRNYIIMCGESQKTNFHLSRERWWAAILNELAVNYQGQAKVKLKLNTCIKV